MSFLIHKILALLIGSFCYYVLPRELLQKLTGGSDLPVTRGADIANLNEDEFKLAAVDFGATLLRINYNNNNMNYAAELAEKFGVEYFVLIGRPEQSPEEIAADILDARSEIGSRRKPKFFSVINEMNEYTYEDLSQVYEALLSNNYDFKVPVVKGPHTGITESAGLKAYFSYFSGKRLDTQDYHDIHYYEKFNKESDSAFTNIQKRALLTYMLIRLNFKGIPASKVVISESHDGTTSWNGIVHGDYVFATKEGWKDIEKVCNRLGVKAVLYYHAAFLSYSENEMLDK